jgi:hypothetical protein
MRRFEFKQATILRSGSSGLGGKHLQFAKGVHDVSDEAMKHPTFKHFAKHGLIVEVNGEQEQKELAPATSDFAKSSQAAAKSLLEPDAEIGGEPQEPEKKSKKGK